MLAPFQLPSFSYGFMPNAETERNGHEGQCAARIGTDCSPPHVWHLATPLNERNNEFFLLKGFTSTYLKETRFSFHAHFSWGPPPLGVIPENGHPQLAGPNRPSPVRPQTKSMATGLARDEIANGSRTGGLRTFSCTSYTGRRRDARYSSGVIHPSPCEILPERNHRIQESRAPMNSPRAAPLQSRA